MTAPPIPSTGDEGADDELALLSLRRRDPPVRFTVIADAIPTTENTVYKIHREARRAEERGEL
jgi:hypothetical protein